MQGETEGGTRGRVEGRGDGDKLRKFSQNDKDSDGSMRSNAKRQLSRLEKNE